MIGSLGLFFSILSLSFFFKYDTEYQISILYFLISVFILGGIDIVLGSVLARMICRYFGFENDIYKSSLIQLASILSLLAFFNPASQFLNDMRVYYHYKEGETTATMRYLSANQEINNHSLDMNEKTKQAYVVSKLLKRTNTMSIPGNKGYEFFKNAYQTCHNGIGLITNEDLNKCLKEHNWNAPVINEKPTLSNYGVAIYIVTQPYVLYHIIFGGSIFDNSNTENGMIFYRILNEYIDNKNN